jgi:Protein of unknown function (DUF2459)
LHHKNSYNDSVLPYAQPPKGCNGKIPIVVHWGAGWHTSIVIPNKGIIVSTYFKNFPFLEVNWGDKGFYQSGASQQKQILAAPKALLLPSQAVMYFVGIPINKESWCSINDAAIQLTDVDKLLLLKDGQKVSHQDLNLCKTIRSDYNILFRYYDAHQIWITATDFSVLTKEINKKVSLNIKGKPDDLGNGYLFNSAYSSAGRFFTSNSSYYGLFNTCNSWTAEVLGKIKSLKSIKDIGVFRSESIFQFFKQEIKNGNSCIKKF